jgi:hypothetical protein
LRLSTGYEGEETMRYFILSAILVSVAAAGCAQTAFSRGTFRAQAGQDLWKEQEGQQLSRRTVPSRFVLGGFGGRLQDSGGAAIQGFSGTKHEDAVILGGSVGYLSPLPAGQNLPTTATRSGLELRYEDFRTLLHWHSTEYGFLHLHSYVPSLRVFWMPTVPGGIGYHFDLGLGQSDATFDKTSQMKEREDASGSYTRVRPGWGTIFAGGLGVDYYIDTRFCLSFSYRFEVIYVPVSWQTDGIKIGKIDQFDISSHMFTIGVFIFF